VQQPALAVADSCSSGFRRGMLCLLLCIAAGTAGCESPRDISCTSSMCLFQHVGCARPTLGCRMHCRRQAQGCRLWRRGKEGAEVTMAYTVVQGSSEPHCVRGRAVVCCTYLRVMPAASRHFHWQQQYQQVARLGAHAAGPPLPAKTASDSEFRLSIALQNDQIL